MKIGVLALQGAFIEHIKILRDLDVEAVDAAVLHPARIDRTDGDVGRLHLTIDDVVRTVLFIIKDAPFMTGSVLRLDGGYVLGGDKVGEMPEGVV